MAISNVQINFKETFEKYNQESLMSEQEKILYSEIGPSLIFMGLIFSLPISLLMWGIIILIIF